VARGVTVATAAPALPTNDDRIRAALWFAGHGFLIFPCWSAHPDGACRCPKARACTNPGKHPITVNGFHDATADEHRIRTFLSAGSCPNYGLVCPDGVFILDVDGTGLEELERLEARLGALPPTMSTITRNGKHVFLRWPADLPRPIGQLFGFVTRWGSGHDSGYVIGPRSIHHTGFAYAPSGVLEIAELPEAWTREVLKPSPDDDDGLIVISSGGYQLPDPGYTGSRYRAIASYVASRYMRGLSKDEVWAGVATVLAPLFSHPVSEEELRDRFERAWRKTPERLGEPVDMDAADIGSGEAVVDRREWPAPPDPAAYHGVLGDIVRAVEDHTEADPVGILGTLLAMTGTCMGHWRTIYQGSNHAANLFVILAGDTSSGRKGTATSVAREVMAAAYPEWDGLIVAGLGSGEGLINQFRGADGDQPPDHRALVMESELGRLLVAMSREGSTLSPIIRDAWDGVPMGRVLAREKSIVKWHHVGIVGHVTSVELSEKLSNGDAANGFGNRFLWLAVRRTQLIPFPQPAGPHVAPYVGRLRAAIIKAQTPWDMHWTGRAADRWEWLYGTLAARQRHGLWGSLLARSEAYITRLALLYALLDGAEHIDVEHLVAAEAVWAYAERSVMHIFGTSTGNRDADSLRDYLANGPLDWEAAKKAIGVSRASELQVAVGLLQSLGIIEVVSEARTGGGRPRRVVRLVKTANHANKVPEEGIA
jgi:hypothetical protein